MRYGQRDIRHNTGVAARVIRFHSRMFLFIRWRGIWAAAGEGSASGIAGTSGLKTRVNGEQLRAQERWRCGWRGQRDSFCLICASHGIFMASGSGRLLGLLADIMHFLAQNIRAAAACRGGTLVNGGEGIGGGASARPLDTVRVRASSARLTTSAVLLFAAAHRQTIMAL
jgi:hypothetical protein